MFFFFAVLYTNSTAGVCTTKDRWMRVDELYKETDIENSTFFFQHLLFKQTVPMSLSYFWKGDDKNVCQL